MRSHLKSSVLVLCKFFSCVSGKHLLKLHISPCWVLILLLSLPLSSAVAGASEGDEVVFYPTDVSQAGELAYLRDSVRMMLACRLAGMAGIQPRLEAEASGKGEKYYQVQSRIVLDGKEVRISASVLNPSSSSPLVFQATGTDSTRVMGAIDDLAAQLGEAFFEVKAQPAQSTAKEKVVVVNDFHTPHPDRQLKENSGYGLAVYQEGNEGTVRATGLHKSPFLSTRVQAMTAADLDGDGLVEILLASDGKLTIYQLRHNLIQHFAVVPLAGGLRVNGLNVADLNGNGLMEIYVSATRGERIASLVLEWSPDAGVSWLAKDVPSYLRTMLLPGEGVVLLGQKRGVEDLVAAGVFRMHYGANGELEDGELLAIPRSVNLFEFVFADTNGNGSSEVVVINKKWQIEIYNTELDLLFTTESGYGGRDLFFGLSKLELEEEKMTGIDVRPEDRDYVYVPIRLIAADVNGDGRDEIIFVENERYSSGFLADTLLYRNGVVRMLTWDSGGLVELFRTNTILNSITDFQLLMEAGKKNGSSSGQLFIVEPVRSDALTTLTIGQRKNRVLVYDLEFLLKE